MVVLVHAFHYLTSEIDPILSVITTCSSLSPCEPLLHIPTEHHLSLLLSDTRWRRWQERYGTDLNDTPATLQTWINLALKWRTLPDGSTEMTSCCSEPCNSVRRSSICVRSPPSLLIIEVTPGTKASVLPCTRLTIPCNERVESYMLTGIIYLGHYHFTSRMIDEKGVIWSYDGQKNNGSPWLDHNCSSIQNPTHLSNIPIFEGRAAYLYIYGRST